MKTWTSAETSCLRRRLAEGKSFGQIADHYGAEIGGRSRCAIAGKCHREGLVGSAENLKLNRRSLTEKQVEIIRNSDEAGVRLAQRLGVSSSVVYRVRNGEGYKNVGGGFKKWRA